MKHPHQQNPVDDAKFNEFKLIFALSRNTFFFVEKLKAKHSIEIKSH